MMRERQGQFGKHRSWAVLAMVGLALISCKKKATDTAMATADPVVLIGRENIAVAKLEELRSGPAISGTLEARTEARVRAELAGQVKRTLVDEGQRVRVGTLLARLDDTAVRDAYLSAKSAVRSAESALQNAKRNEERASRLARAGALPERDLETAQLNATSAEGALADAQARLALAGKQLANTVVRAPISGAISERAVDPGDVVQVGAALFTVVDLSSLRLEATVPVEEIDRLKVGSPVEFSVSGYDRRFNGRIERINPAVDPATRQVRIYVVVPNAEQSLVSGLYAEGRVATDARRTVAVPSSAVDRRGTAPVIHRLKGGKVEVMPVRLGVRDEATELVEILSGVSPGDTVLLGSAQGVTEGAPVRISDEEEASR
ncbi:MAG: rane fusion protein multidrug efflux system [Gemmatimonadales bacterium]|nr:rane fusion protein multidrug efflux system [Gemmatimonadales bacterium]